MTQDRSVLNRKFREINPVTYGAERCGPGHSYGYAIRDYYLIHYVVSGKGTFIREGMAYQLRRHCMFLIRPQERTFYQADEKEPWEYVWIGFDGEKSAEFLEQAGFSEGRCWLDQPQAGRIFQELSMIPDQEPSTELMLCAKIYELIAVLINGRKPARTPAGDYAARTADYIRANYALPVSIQKIADMLGIDRRYLSRIFLEKYGCTPKEFLIRIRLSRAAELLETADCSVSDAAKAVGYEDVFNFSKMFKKSTGLSPLHYRERT